MKNKLIPSALALAILSLAACSQPEREQTSDQVRQAYEETKDAFSDTWTDVKDYTYEKRDDFRDRSAALTAKFDAEVSELQAKQASAQASASRQAAMQELRDARANLSEKTAALGNATSDTWTSAKAEVVAAWDRAVAAYREAQANAS
jgi:hypothetical protein